jgi:hypothetical protein
MKSGLRGLAQEAFSRDNVAASGVLDVDPALRLWRGVVDTRHVERGHGRRICLLLRFFEGQREDARYFGFGDASAGRA